MLLAGKPRSKVGLLLIVGLWVVSAGLLLWAFWPGTIAAGHL